MWRQGTFALILGLFLTSCGTIQQIGVNTASDLFYRASEEMETEGNWELFKEGVPANLKLMEGMLYIRPHDDEFLVSLTKGHAGYAYAVHETLWLEDKLQDKESSPHKQQALFHYSRAFEYALRYFEEEDLTYKKMKQSLPEKEGLPGLLSEYLDADSKKDLEAALFAGQALAAMVNMQRDDMLMVAELPLAKGLFDWVCDKRPNINFGACQIFYGAYYAGRPAMLGGNPPKGKKIFLELIEKNPHNWLAKASYMQYYLIPQAKEEEYEKYASQMRELRKKHQNQLVWGPDSPESERESFAEPRLRVYQAMAMKRFEMMEKHRDELF